MAVLKRLSIQVSISDLKEALENIERDGFISVGLEIETDEDGIMGEVVEVTAIDPITDKKDVYAVLDTVEEMV